jgi:hypothetical protein
MSHLNFFSEFGRFFWLAPAQSHLAAPHGSGEFAGYP